MNKDILNRPIKSSMWDRKLLNNLGDKNEKWLIHGKVRWQMDKVANEIKWKRERERGEVSSRRKRKSLGGLNTLFLAFLYSLVTKA